MRAERKLGPAVILGSFGLGVAAVWSGCGGNEGKGATVEPMGTPTVGGPTATRTIEASPTVIATATQIVEITPTAPATAVPTEAPPSATVQAKATEIATVLATATPQIGELPTVEATATEPAVIPTEAPPQEPTLEPSPEPTATVTSEKITLEQAIVMLDDAIDNVQNPPADTVQTYYVPLAGWESRKKVILDGADDLGIFGLNDIREALLRGDIAGAKGMIAQKGFIKRLTDPLGNDAGTDEPTVLLTADEITALDPQRALIDPAFAVVRIAEARLKALKDLSGLYYSDISS